MPITPIHISINYFIYFVAVLISPLEFKLEALALIALAELIDLDHLNKKPIYKKNRNSFKHHFFHKNWKITGLMAIILVFFYPITYFSLAILSHLAVDFLYTKYYLKL